MRISLNFAYEHFLVSADYPEIAAEMFFTPTEAERTRAFVLYLWQPMRTEIGEAIYMLSGKRTPELNDAIPGSHPNSDHLYKPEIKSIAADGTCENIMKMYDYLNRHRTLFKMAYLNRKKKFMHVSGLDNLTRKGGNGSVKII